MPQMSPMWWEMLFIMFIMLNMNMIVIMFFNYNKKINTENSYKMISNFNFKW
uniref:ATP synthase F0 subunit 8 n=1 Tax=Dimorphopterus gibbus TaxID=2969359 RepID=UPI002176E4D3|nr:ATP synthase F0 subunit 8 [Dimorphopterus gibbus]UUJ37754.1 ATP synthase F0 subunit 8 [Dimorphopterus gibbus]